MQHFFLVISGILKITLLDIVLSGDNIGVIALATKDLPSKLAKKASMVGVAAAIFLRILFTCFVTYILLIQWLPIRLIGGIILIYITLNFIKPSDEEEEVHEIKSNNKFSSAILSIIFADMTMSLDNVLAIAASAHGSIFLIVFGLALNIPIIFFGSVYVAKVMRKYPIVIYIGAAVLAHTAFEMLLSDNLVKGVIPVFLIKYIPIAAAIIIIAYGYYIVTSKKDSK